MKINTYLAGLVLTCAMAFEASAIEFTKLTGNNAEDLSSQFLVTVDQSQGAGTVSFTFQNNVGIASVISEIYFDDGLFGAAQISTETGVDFDVGANPAALPGGNLADPAFVTSTTFNTSAENPAPHNGINSATDLLKITFGLGSFADLDAVLAALEDGSLRIGLHVTGIGVAGGSDSYVTGGGDDDENPPPGVPDAGSTLALMGIALGGLGVLRRNVKA